MVVILSTPRVTILNDIDMLHVPHRASQVFRLSLIDLSLSHVFSWIIPSYRFLPLGHKLFSRNNPKTM